MVILEEPVSEKDLLKWRSALIQYAGGGYDGCVWEWNYAFLDPNGKFHNVLSTGSRGCTSMDDLEQVLTMEFDSFPPNPAVMFLAQEDSFEAFRAKTNDGNVLFVAKWLQEHWPEFTFHGSCDTCQGRFPIHTAEHDGYTGNGGIGIAMEGIVCPACVERAVDAGDAEFYHAQPPVGGSPEANEVSGEALAS